MKYIIKALAEKEKIRYYKGMKKNPYFSGVLADWSCEEKEAKTFDSKETAISNAKSINGIAIIGRTEVIQIEETTNIKKCIFSVSESKRKKETKQLLDAYLDRRVQNE